MLALLAFDILPSGQFEMRSLCSRSIYARFARIRNVCFANERGATSGYSRAAHRGQGVPRGISRELRHFHILCLPYGEGVTACRDERGTPPQACPNTCPYHGNPKTRKLVSGNPYHRKRVPILAPTTGTPKTRKRVSGNPYHRKRSPSPVGEAWLPSRRFAAYRKNRGDNLPDFYYL